MEYSENKRNGVFQVLILVYSQLVVYLFEGEGVELEELRRVSHHEELVFDLQYLPVVRVLVLGVIHLLKWSHCIEDGKIFSEYDRFVDQMLDIGLVKIGPNFKNQFQNDRGILVYL